MQAGADRAVPGARITSEYWDPELGDPYWVMSELAILIAIRVVFLHIEPMHEDPSLTTTFMLGRTAFVIFTLSTLLSCLDGLGTAVTPQQAQVCCQVIGSKLVVIFLLLGEVIAAIYRTACASLRFSFQPTSSNLPPSSSGTYDKSEQPEAYDMLKWGFSWVWDLGPLRARENAEQTGAGNGTTEAAQQVPDEFVHEDDAPALDRDEAREALRLLAEPYLRSNPSPSGRDISPALLVEQFYNEANSASSETNTAASETNNASSETNIASSATNTAPNSAPGPVRWRQRQPAGGS
eukprot:2688742-Prymnesium_polylepis.1